MNKLNIVLPFNSKLCGASSSWFLQRFSDWYMHLEFDFNENLLMWVRASNYIAVKNYEQILELTFVDSKHFKMKFHP